VKYYRKDRGDGTYDYREYNGPVATRIAGIPPMTVYPWKTFDDDSGCDEKHQWDRFLDGAQEITEAEYVKAWKASLLSKLDAYEEAIRRVHARLEA